MPHDEFPPTHCITISGVLTAFKRKFFYDIGNIDFAVLRYNFCSPLGVRGLNMGKGNICWFHLSISSFHLM
jgi:hypothetical protein